MSDEGKEHQCLHKEMDKLVKRHFLVIYAGRTLLTGDMVGNMEIINHGPLTYDSVEAFTQAIKGADPKLLEVVVTNIVPLEG